MDPRTSGETPGESPEWRCKTEMRAQSERRKHKVRVWVRAREAERRSNKPKPAAPRACVHTARCLACALTRGIKGGEGTRGDAIFFRTCSSLCSGGKMVVRKCHVPSFWPKPLPGVVAMPVVPHAHTARASAQGRQPPNRSRRCLDLPAAPAGPLLVKGARARKSSACVAGVRAEAEDQPADRPGACVRVGGSHFANP